MKTSKRRRAKKTKKKKAHATALRGDVLNTTCRYAIHRYSSIHGGPKVKWNLPFDLLPIAVAKPCCCVQSQWNRIARLEKTQRESSNSMRNESIVWIRVG